MQIRLRIPILVAGLSALTLLSGIQAMAQTEQIGNTAPGNGLSGTYPYNYFAAEFVVGASDFQITSAVIPIGSTGNFANAFIYSGTGASSTPTSTNPLTTSNSVLVPISNSPSSVTFTFASGTTLHANTTYWLAFGNVSNPPYGTNYYINYVTTADNSTSTNGSSTGIGALSSDGHSWLAVGNFSFDYKIYGTSVSSVPEPGTATLLLGCGVLLSGAGLRARRRRSGI